MRFGGLQKLTLLDYPGKIACTVFTSGCSFRCPFCHNALLVTKISENESVSEEEILSFLSKRAGILEGVCLTGGEPLLWEDAGEFLRKVKNMGYSVKLDTNGGFPDRLIELCNGGLVDYVAMDIKNSPAKYELTAGMKGVFDDVKRSINFLLNGNIPFEFRTTVVKEYHNPADFDEIGRLIAGDEPYFLQWFADSGELISRNLHDVSKETMNECLQTVKKYVPNASIRGDKRQKGEQH